MGAFASAGATSDVLGENGIGDKLNRAMNGLHGTEVGVQDGLGGFTAHGQGPGGGPGIDIHGTGQDHFGPGYGPDHGSLGFGPGGKPPTHFVPGKTSVVGGLTADEVGRIIRRHWNEIKYCYEKELSKNPNLAGKVATSFQIGPLGDVVRANVSETDLHSPDVEECMLKNVRNWKFPNPRDGGVVDVSYPFIFQSGG
jgi:hypothetical protein